MCGWVADVCQCVLFVGGCVDDSVSCVCVCVCVCVCLVHKGIILGACEGDLFI